MKHFIVAVSMFVCAAALATEQKINVPSDSDAEYSIVSVEVSGPVRVAIVKRAERDSVSYSKREYDCAKLTTRSMGTGSKLENLAIAKPDSSVTRIARGAVTQYVGPAVCNYNE